MPLGVESDNERLSLWISGVPRSGTTLLANMLTLHPSLAVIHETQYIRGFLWLVNAERLRVAGAVTRLKRNLGYLFRVRPSSVRGLVVDSRQRFMRGVHDTARWLQSTRDATPTERNSESMLFATGQLYLEPAELIAEGARAVQSLAEAQSAKEVTANARTFILSHHELQKARADRPRWCNKTPGLAHRLNALRSVMGDLRMVHLVRDGRDVALSWVRHREAEEHLPNMTIRDAAIRWSRNVTMAVEQGSRYPTMYLEVRYESLVQNPAPELNRILDFFGLDRTGDAMVSEYRRLSKAASRGAIHANSCEKWRTMQPAMLQEIHSLAGDTLERLRYRMP